MLLPDELGGVVDVMLAMVSGPPRDQGRSDHPAVLVPSIDRLLENVTGNVHFVTRRELVLLCDSFPDAPESALIVGSDRSVAGWGLCRPPAQPPRTSKLMHLHDAYDESRLGRPGYVAVRAPLASKIPEYRKLRRLSLRTGLRGKATMIAMRMRLRVPGRLRDPAGARSSQERSRDRSSERWTI